MADEQEVQQPQEQPLNPDLMGYPNVEALVNAKRASDAEAQKIKAERDALKTQLQYVYQPEANPRQDVKRRDRPEDQLTEMGIPVDALDDFFNRRLQKAFEPVLAAANARSTVVGKYPDYNKFEPDVNQFLQADPELNQAVGRMAQADPAGALEYAFLKFGESRRKSVNGNRSQGDVTDAQIPSSRGGETRRMPDSVSGDVQRAWQNYQKQGTSQAAAEYAKARLKTVIKDEFLNQ
jgi:hypothetical protein